VTTGRHGYLRLKGDLLEEILTLPDPPADLFPDGWKENGDPHTLQCNEYLLVWLNMALETHTRPYHKVEVFKASVELTVDYEVVVFDNDIDQQTWDYGKKHKEAHFLNMSLERAILYVWACMTPEAKVRYGKQSAKPQYVEIPLHENSRFQPFGTTAFATDWAFSAEEVKEMRDDWEHSDPF
jgi:hypothetical protein